MNVQSPSREHDCDTCHQCQIRHKETIEAIRRIQYQGLFFNGLGGLTIMMIVLALSPIAVNIGLQYYLTNNHNLQDTSPQNYVTPQHKVFLRSPNYALYDPSETDPVQAPLPSQGDRDPVQVPQMLRQPPPPRHSSYTKGRDNPVDEEDLGQSEEKP